MLSDEMLKKALSVIREDELADLDRITEPHDFSKKFEHKMNVMIHNENKPYFRLVRTAGQRAAVIIIIVVLTGLTTVMSVDALREGFFKMVRTIYEKFSVITYDEVESSPEREFEVYHLSAIPNDYHLEDEMTDPDNRTYIAFYRNDHGAQIAFQQIDLADADFTINTEGVELERFFENGNEYYFYSNIGVQSLIWQDDYYSLMITSEEMDKEELLALADSLQKK